MPARVTRSPSGRAGDARQRHDLPAAAGGLGFLLRLRPLRAPLGRVVRGRDDAGRALGGVPLLLPLLLLGGGAGHREPRVQLEHAGLRGPHPADVVEELRGPCCDWALGRQWVGVSGLVMWVSW
jgi:hypothetical protein